MKYLLALFMAVSALSFASSYNHDYKGVNHAVDEIYKINKVVEKLNEKYPYFTKDIVEKDPDPIIQYAYLQGGLDAYYDMVNYLNK